MILFFWAFFWCAISLFLFPFIHFLGFLTFAFSFSFIVLISIFDKKISFLCYNIFLLVLLIGVWEYGEYAKALGIYFGIQWVSGIILTLFSNLPFQDNNRSELKYYFLCHAVALFPFITLHLLCFVIF